ncbi:MAG: OadG family protein [Clostridiales bacterium]|nr:OadG family protein [Clostridiales bacterium]
MNLTFLSVSDVPIGTAALYAVIGFVIVVAVLALLVGIFLLSGLIFRTKALSREKLFESKKVPKQLEPEFIPSAVPERSEDDEVVAAITAAITVLLSEECEPTEKPDFVIRKIVRNK